MLFKPVYDLFFCGTQNRVFWEIRNGNLIIHGGQWYLVPSIIQNIFFSYSLGMAWRWVNDERIRIFGRTIPLTLSCNNFSTMTHLHERIFQMVRYWSKQRVSNCGSTLLNDSIFRQVPEKIQVLLGINKLLSKSITVSRASGSGCRPCCWKRAAEGLSVIFWKKPM